MARKTKKIAKKSKALKKFTPKADAKKMLNFVLEYRALKFMPRGCFPFLKGPAKENVAEHIFYTTILGWVLAKMEKKDENKIIKMCLLHDLCEVRGGERNLINKFYSPPFNESAMIREIVRDYELEKFNLEKLQGEFNKEKSAEAKIAKDADVLSQMLLEKDCLELGNRSAVKWLHFSLGRLKTKSGQILGRKLIELEGDEWWLDIDKKYLYKTKFI